MGCVSYSWQYFADGKIRWRGFKAAQLAAAQALEPIQAEYQKVGWDEAVGTSGTIRTTEDILRRQGWSERGITLDGLVALREALLEAGEVGALTLLEGQRERAPVFPGGLAILIAVFEALGIRRMMTSQSALREGVLFDLLGRLGTADVRQNTIANLCARFRVDLEQAARVVQIGPIFSDR
jgi:exopolyphosphatase/guanosine-5'-triphosphate,3'-diphosphate pyrophosphatase